VKIASLLKSLEPIREIKVEERIHSDGKHVYIFSAAYPFPHVPEPVWYPIVLNPGQEEIDDREIEAMLRHLWMFQINVGSEAGTVVDLAASAEGGVLDPDET